MGGFVFQNAGKLRDYYRIGKMLGSGMNPTLNEIVRCFRRGENVCAQRDRLPESSEGAPQEPHGRRREENAL
jgi:hypothetical protein